MKRSDERSAPSEEGSSLRSRGHADRAHTLLTLDWRSAALVRVGAFWQEKGDVIRATRAYVDALARDAENVGALLNLGGLNARSKDASDWARGRDRLEAAVGATPDPARDGMPDRVWYRTRYWLAATNAHIAVERDRNPNGPYGRAEFKDVLSKAEKRAAEVITDALKAQRENSDVLLRHPDLREFIEMVEGSTVVLLAGIWAQDRLRVRRALPRKVDPELPSERPPLPPAYDVGARLDEELIKRLSTRTGGFRTLSYRARYNLACYYSTIEKAEDSLRELRYGLERCDLASWAPNDPSLAHVQTTRKADFDAILATCAADTTPAGTALKSVTLIGEKLAGRLAKLGIDTVDRLALRVRSAADRTTLAAELGVELGLIEEWALVVALERLEGIELDEANLLYEAGVRSVQALAGWSDAAALTRLLRDTNSARSILKAVPEVTEVAEWIERARQVRLKPIILIR